MFGLDLQKDGAILALGLALGAGGALAGSHLISTVWKITPFSAESKLDKTRVQLDTCTFNAGVLTSQVQAGKDMINQHIQAEVDAAKASADSYSQGVDRWAGQCKDAYQSGVVAGRVIGRREASGASPAKPAAAGPAAAPGGVRNDFSTGWALGAYVPPAKAPAGPLPR